MRDVGGPGAQVEQRLAALQPRARARPGRAIADPCHRSGRDSTGRSGARSRRTSPRCDWAPWRAGRNHGLVVGDGAGLRGSLLVQTRAIVNWTRADRWLTNVNGRRRGDEIQDPDVAVEIERALDLRQIVGADERLLVHQQRGDDRDAGRGRSAPSVRDERRARPGTRSAPTCIDARDQRASARRRSAPGSSRRPWARSNSRSWHA